MTFSEMQKKQPELYRQLESKARQSGLIDPGQILASQDNSLTLKQWARLEIKHFDSGGFGLVIGQSNYQREGGNSLNQSKGLNEAIEQVAAAANAKRLGTKESKDPGYADKGLTAGEIKTVEAIAAAANAKRR